MTPDKIFRACGVLLLAASVGGCALVTVVDAGALNTVEKKQRDFDALPHHTKALHKSLLVADLHADTLMLDRGGVRGIQKTHSYGHLDAPRLRAGNVGFQVLTVATVTPVPYSPALNGGWILPNAQWLISPLQGWPVRTWFNSREHALHQARKWRANTSGESAPFVPIRRKQDLSAFLEEHYRRSNTGWLPLNPHEQPVATVLGLEGCHALRLHEADSDEAIGGRLREFRDAGFRMLALTHRFNNRLAGASEGSELRGVTALGHRVLTEMGKLGLICDLAHASEATIRDVLDRHPRLPVMVSHGGIAFEPLVGRQQSRRLLSIESARRIAGRGGVIGIGLWPEAIGDAEPELAVAMIKRCISDPQIGARHVALGSDMDGAVRAAFACDHYALLTHELRDLDPVTLHDIMGGNVIRFYLEHLPSR